MPPKLFAARYNTAGTSLLEFIQDPADVGIRWELPFGPIRAEVTVKNKSRFDGYARYSDHHGQRICVLDSYLDAPVFDGWVYEVRLDGQFTTYIIGGPVFRHSDSYYEVGDKIASGDTDAWIKDILTDKVTILSTDQSNIASTSTNADYYGFDFDEGVLPADAIKELSLMSDASDNLYDYWVKTAPLAGVLPQAPIPYFSARSTSASVDWRINRGDMSQDGARISRNIWNLKRSVTVWYGVIYGYHAAVANSANLIDSLDRNFVDLGVNVGDRV